MRHSLSALAFTCVVLSLTSAGGARPVALSSYREMYKRADIVVIATPTDTRDLSQRRKLLDLPAVGVETSFKVQALLKGRVKGNTIVLHHYRFDYKAIEAASNQKEEVKAIIAAMDLINHALPVRFPGDSEAGYPGEYLMFLVREKDGRYVPLLGQVDSFTSIRRLELPDTDDPIPPKGKDSKPLPANREKPTSKAKSAPAK